MVVVLNCLAIQWIICKLYVLDAMGGLKPKDIGKEGRDNMSILINNTTATGKAGKTLLWTAISVILVSVVSTIIDRPELFNPVVVATANIILVFLKNFVDSDVDNI